jgi:hypothetical protein
MLSSIQPTRKVNFRYRHQVRRRKNESVGALSLSLFAIMEYVLVYVVAMSTLTLALSMFAIGDRHASVVRSTTGSGSNMDMNRDPIYKKDLTSSARALSLIRLHQ